MAEIDYHVVRSRKRKKTLMLKIERDGSVVMRVPLHTAESDIERFFREKLEWLRKKLREREQCGAGALEKRCFQPGERFLYLGEYYPLEMREPGPRRSHLALSHGVFYLERDRAPGQARDLFIKWYKERAREIFSERVHFHGRQLDLIPREIKISSARTRYGSCSAVNVLSFSFRLVMAPYRIIDYVIVHELAHIKIKNHSRRFWRYIEDIMPDYRDCKQWLREHNAAMDV